MKEKTMKHVVPFDIPHPMLPKEDYFRIGADAGGGEFLQTNKLSFLSMAKTIWRQDVHAHGRGFPFPEMTCFFARKSVYTPHNDILGSKWWTMSVSKAFQLLKGAPSWAMFKAVPNFRKRYREDTCGPSAAGSGASGMSTRTQLWST